MKTIADFGDGDHIATPAVGMSVQSRMLQLASARVWGDDQYAKLDRLQVALPHPEAAAAILKGGTEINAHFASPPFQEQELAGNPAAHIVLKSYDVLGGPSSATLTYTTEKFRSDNPRTYKAFVAALAEAVRIVRSEPPKAAEIFIRSSRSSIDAKTVVSIITSADFDFKLTPQHTLGLATFMQRVGAIKTRPTTAHDYLFDDAHNAGAD